MKKTIEQLIQDYLKKRSAWEAARGMPNRYVLKGNYDIAQRLFYKNFPDGVDEFYYEDKIFKRGRAGKTLYVMMYTKESWERLQEYKRNQLE